MNKKRIIKLTIWSVIFTAALDLSGMAVKHLIKKKKEKPCPHRRKSRMTWPDGGDSELCTDCLKTRYHTEMDTTEWQDHGYVIEADWYKEGFEMAVKMRATNGPPRKRKK